ncbi:hypothetical protein TNCV_876761 [Trichonephila clavipes]|nr:hypothetical protein TNCV_876761 [Trichonephila clavipes]
MSALEAIENYNDWCHPVVCNVLDITSGLYSKSFDIAFYWLLSHVGIIGNEHTESAARFGDDPFAASSSAIGHEARHPASYFYYQAGIMELAVR